MTWWIVQRNVEPNTEIGDGSTNLETPEHYSSDSFSLKQHEQLTNESEPVLVPERTILNVNCKMLTGSGPASGVAVVILKEGDESVFAVLDESGEIVSDRLDFHPHHFRIGRRPDGSVLVGFGDLRLNSGVFRSPDTDEPVRIYHDEHIIYESSKVMDFDIASDGSSFFALEPSPGGASRLVVRKIESDFQKEIELGTKFSSSNDYELGGHTPFYSLDNSEIMFTPTHMDAMGVGEYWIYPVGEGRSSKVTVQDSWAAVLTSSENGYFVDRPDELSAGEAVKVWQVTRRKIDAAGGSIEDVWTRRIHIERHYGGLTLSPNGRWLGMSGWDYKVIDTESGETIFTYPLAGKPEQKLARLAPVLPVGATVSDMGRHGQLRFIGDSLVVFRIYGDTSSCSPKFGEEYDAVKRRECIRDLRLQDEYRTYFDVYDMNTIELESSPSYTTEVFEESTCMPALNSWSGLIDIEGQLAYRPQLPPKN